VPPSKALVSQPALILDEQFAKRPRILARWYDICNAEKNVGGRDEEDLPPAGNNIVKRLSLVWNEPDLSLEPLDVLADEYGDTEAPVQGGSRREIVGCHKLHLMMRL
jgi:hypothetical protein